MAKKRIFIGSAWETKEVAYFRAAAVWSERPQRGAGRAKDYRPRGVSYGPLEGRRLSQQLQPDIDCNAQAKADQESE
jgi:hypothetical protein